MQILVATQIVAHTVAPRIEKEARKVHQLPLLAAVDTRAQPGSQRGRSSITGPPAGACTTRARAPRSRFLTALEQCRYQAPTRSIAGVHPGHSGAHTIGSGTNPLRLGAGCPGRP